MPADDLKERTKALDIALSQIEKQFGKGSITGPLRQRVARRVAGRVLLVGDAGGYVDALTGEGISLGMAQAQAAVSAVEADRPHAYERAWRRASWRYSAMTYALVQATRPAWARQAIVPTAAALPTVFRAAVGELGRSH